MVFDMQHEEIEILLSHLRTQYSGIFDEAMIAQHINEYVDTTNSEAFADYLVACGHKGQKMLDIGAGYGANVLAARQKGIDAIGIEPEAFEVNFARSRLKRLRPENNSSVVYRQGDGMALPFQDESFDVVSLMNVIEHVPDYRRLLVEVMRVLRPGGMLYAICPNYGAFRREAHYHVPWFPFFQRKVAALYLQLLGRNPAFFERHIHYCTNWGILRTISELPAQVLIPGLEKVDNISLVNNGKLRVIFSILDRAGLSWLARLAVRLHFYNPLKETVNLVARKLPTK